MNKDLLIQIIYQGIGIIALTISAISFQCKSLKKLLILQCAASVLWCTHFAIGGAFAACLMNGLCIIRSIAYAFIKDKKWRWTFTSLICVMFIGTGVISVICLNELWYIATITAVASVVGNIFFSIGNSLLYKYVQLGFISPCWLFNNINCKSIGGIICESFNMISIIVFIVKMLIQNKNSKKQNNETI